MKISQIEPEKRYDKKKFTSYGIQGFGEKNDYPQRVHELVGASVTGSSCLRIYQKFIQGKGFKDKAIYQLRANERESLDSILENIAADYAEHGGFAIHVNYNANYQIVDIHHAPVEHVRLGLPNDQNQITTVSLHPDWGKRNTEIKSFNQKNIVTIDLYNPDPAVIDAQVAAAGGWDKWNGQILYYSNKGAGSYALPIYDSALVDMNTEEAVSDITNRNAAHGFLPAAMVVEIKGRSNYEPDEDENKEGDEGGWREREEVDETQKSLLKFQGSKNAGNLMLVQVESKEEVPEIKPLTKMNYDKEFTVSRDAAKDSIGRAFNQPPILRAEQTSQGFSTDVMQQAYDYYNSVTENERLTIERVLTEIFSHWYESIDRDFTIDQCTFNAQTTLAERLGDNKLAKLLDVLNGSQPKSVKIQIARIIFGLTDDEIAGIFEGDVQTAPTTQTPQAV